MLEWVAVPSSRASSPAQDWTCISVSCTGRQSLHDPVFGGLQITNLWREDLTGAKFPISSISPLNVVYISWSELTIWPHLLKHYVLRHSPRKCLQNINLLVTLVSPSVFSVEGSFDLQTPHSSRFEGGFESSPPNWNIARILLLQLLGSLGLLSSTPPCCCLHASPLAEVFLLAHSLLLLPFPP